MADKKRMMRRRRFCAGGMLAASLTTSLAGTAATGEDRAGAAPVSYELSFPDAAHHRARVVATWRNVPPGPLRVQMARSSPGRYALHEFAKNVSAVAARDGAGRPLPLTRTDPYGWSIAGHDGTVSVSYALYGDRGDGTYVQVDGSHAHLNPPAALMFATGYDDRPVRVHVTPPEAGWTVATQLENAGGPNSFVAPNLQLLMDSPIEIGPVTTREWTVGEGKARQTIRLALHHAGSEADADRFAAQIRRLLPQHQALFGEWPRFDHQRYTFLADYLPNVSGDGMEHRNSTVVTGSEGLDGSNADQLGTVSHEFIHAWNVERLRPAELEPFDFTRANPTPSLWFAEGFTSYYGPLLIRRAGLSDTEAYLSELSRMVSLVVNAPARANGGPQEMSLRAPFADAATSNDPVDPAIYLSYYPYGAVVALALDLSIRQRFPNLSLDDYMRQLWRSHGRAERPYAADDLRRGLAAATGDAAFADAFFAASVSGSALPDLAPLLAQAGLLLRPAEPGRGWLGIERVAEEGGGVRLTAAPPPGSPLYAAGLDRGDRIVALGGTAVTSAGDWAAALARLTPGAMIDLRFEQGGRERQATLRAIADPTLAIVRAEATGQKATARQLAFRRRWLGDAAVEAAR